MLSYYQDNTVSGVAIRSRTRRGSACRAWPGSTDGGAVRSLGKVVWVCVTSPSSTGPGGLSRWLPPTRTVVGSMARRPGVAEVCPHGGHLLGIGRVMVSSSHRSALAVGRSGPRAPGRGMPSLMRGRTQERFAFTQSRGRHRGSPGGGRSGPEHVRDRGANSYLRK